MESQESHSVDTREAVRATSPVGNRMTRRRYFGAPLLAAARPAGVALAGAVVAACGPFQGGQGASRAVQDATIEVWHPWDGTREPLFNKMAQEFEQLYPTIKVRPLVVLSTIHTEKFIAASVAGTPPAIANPGNTQLPDFVLRGLVEPLDALMKQEKVRTEDYFEPDMLAASFQGKFYYLPAYAGTGRRLLYRNTRHFSEAGLDPTKAPLTWDDFEAAERKLTVREGTEIKRQAFWGESFRRWLFSAGGKWVTDDGRKLLFGDAIGLEVLEWMKRRTDSIYGSWAARAAFQQARSNGALQKDGFYTHELSMTVNNQSIFFESEQVAPTLQYAVSAAPVKRPGFPPNVVEGLAGYSISKGFKTPREAFLTIKYFSYDERGCGWFMKEQKRPSPVQKHNENP
jgi:ABC-type glycerol-3-phosphate transport system substrate-binding protein